MGSLKSAKQNEEKSRQQKTFTKQAEDKFKKNNGTSWCSSVIDTFQQKWTKYRPPQNP